MQAEKKDWMAYFWHKVDTKKAPRACLGAFPYLFLAFYHNCLFFLDFLLVCFWNIEF